MSGSGKFLRYAAFGMMALFGLLGGLFVAGYAFEDPGGWAAVGLTALWVVPMAALSVFALLRPDAAARVFVWVTAAVVVFALADSAFGIIPRDDWGPVTAIAVFALGVALAFLGLHRPTLAGGTMVFLALMQLAAAVVAVVAHGSGDRPGPGALLGGSSGVVIVPLLVTGLLFLLAGSLTPTTPTTPEQPGSPVGSTH